LRLAALSLAAASVLCASSPAFWELSSYTEFLKGKLNHVAISRDGVLSVAPALDLLFPTAQAYLWSLARTVDGTIYAGTGNHGRLFRIDPTGKGAVIWTAPQPEIFAVAAGPGGVVFAGTSPNGRIYRIENGTAKEYFNPKATYIWSLALGADGALYAGTGGEGRIYRITAVGQGEEYFATGQANVTGLAFDGSGALLAGSEPNGILYRINAKDKAFVLYDSNLPEIRAMASGADGSVYAAGLGGSVAKKTQSAAQGAAATVSETPTMTTSITVTAEAAHNTAEIKPPAPEAAKPPAVTATTTAAAPAATVDLTGVEKSAIYQIHPDLTVETLWSSKEENVYDILPGADGLLFATDLGRIYRLTANRRLTLVTQTGEGDLARLFRDGKTVLAAAGTGGKIYRLGSPSASSGGSYESPVFDAGTISRWGSGRRAGAGMAELWTRSGNSLRPDRTWSEWAPLPANGLVASPNARYLVWKAELAPNASVESVSVGYLPQNNAPLVRSITALTTMQPAAAPTKTSGSAAATSSYSITVTDTGDAGPSTSTGTAVQTLSRAGSQQLILSWQAEDPDGDKLVYSVAFRGEGEREWKLLKANLHENSLTLDADALADGRYYFRVTASDRETNAGASAREAELVSSPVLIDNTPPRVTAGPVHGRAFDFEAVDAASALKRAEYAVDGGAWIPVNPVSGILDSKQARFHVDLKDQPPGEHVVVVRALDLANNSGQAKVILP